MPNENNPPAINTSPVISYLAGLYWHAGRMLVFRHCPDELRTISQRHAVGLTAIGVSMVMACTHYAPAPTTGYSPGLCAVFSIAIALALRTFGTHAVAGYAVFLIATQPVALLAHHLPMGEQIDSAFSLWCMAAVSVFGFKCAKIKLECRR